MDGTIAKTIRIRILFTVTSPRVEAALRKQRECWSEPNVIVEVKSIAQGPYSLVFAAEEAVAAPYILEAILHAEHEGVDAVVIECIVDPALRAARELVKIPVMSTTKAGMAFAISVGTRIAIITLTDLRSKLEEVIRAYGLSDHVCAFKAIDVPPADAAEALRYCFDLLSAEAETAIHQDRADVVLLGGSVLSVFASDLQQLLGVPVIEPAACSIRMAIDLVRLGISHSKRAYPTPPDRPLAPGSISVWRPTEKSSFLNA